MKKGFLNYGKSEDEDEGEGEGKPKKKDDEDEGKDDDGGPSAKRIMYLAEQTGVENPKALIRLIKACME